MRFLGWRSRAVSIPSVAEAGGPRQWLPIIDRDRCQGCGLCLQACARHCLELVWDFATLVRAGDCSGEGRCAAACPDQLIRMGWVQPTARDGRTDAG